MAKRRMFSLDIVDTDAFLDMPTSSQNLYFHLGMRADDDGFVANPRRIAKVIGSSEDDLKILIAKRFLLAFDSGVVVIKHWKMNNYVPPDRYTPTNYQEEAKLLFIKNNKSYTFDKTQAKKPLLTECIHDVYKMDTQVSIGKDSIGKISIDKDSIGKDKENKEINKENNARARENTQISNYGNEKLDKFSEVANYNWLDKHKR